MRRKMAFLAGRPPLGSVLGVVAEGVASPTSPSSLPGSRASASTHTARDRPAALPVRLGEGTTIQASITWRSAFLSSLRWGH